MMQQDEPGQDTGVIVIKQRQKWTVSIGLMIVILALGIAIAEPQQPSTGNRIGVPIFFGFFIVLCIMIWIGSNRRRDQIEVTQDAIKYVRRSGRVALTLPRSEIDNLRIIRRLSDRKLFLVDRLVVTGTDSWMTLHWFSTRAVRQACLARGWRFDGAC
jgi:hypothetical protein